MDRPTTPLDLAGPGPAGPAPVRARDRRLGYGWAVLVILVGVTTAVLWAVTGLLDQIQHPEQFARSAVPGVAAVTVTQTGAHVIYAESPGPSDLTAADLTVVGPGGVPLSVRPYTRDLRYDVPGTPGHVGTAVGVFDADRTGTYQVSSSAVAPEGTTTLAVGDDLAPEVIRSVALPSAFGVLAVLAGLGLALSTWIHDERRSRS